MSSMWRVYSAFDLPPDSTLTAGVTVCYGLQWPSYSQWLVPGTWQED